MEKEKAQTIKFLKNFLFWWGVLILANLGGIYAYLFLKDVSTLFFKKVPTLSTGIIVFFSLTTLLLIVVESVALITLYLIFKIEDD